MYADAHQGVGAIKIFPGTTAAFRFEKSGNCASFGAEIEAAINLKLWLKEKTCPSDYLNGD